MQTSLIQQYHQCLSTQIPNLLINSPTSDSSPAHYIQQSAFLNLQQHQHVNSTLLPQSPASANNASHHSRSSSVSPKYVSNCVTWLFLTILLNSASASIQQHQQQQQQRSVIKAANPFGDSFNQMNDNELFGIEFDRLRNNVETRNPNQAQDLNNSTSGNQPISPRTSDHHQQQFVSGNDKASSNAIPKNLNSSNAIVPLSLSQHHSFSPHQVPPSPAYSSSYVSPSILLPTSQITSKNMKGHNKSCSLGGTGFMYNNNYQSMQTNFASMNQAQILQPVIFVNPYNRDANSAFSSSNKDIAGNNSSAFMTRSITNNST